MVPVVGLLTFIALGSGATSLKAASYGKNLGTSSGGFLRTEEPPTCPDGCSPAECGHPQESDISKPFTQVLRNQAGVEGFCYYSQLGAWWMKGVHKTLKDRELEKKSNFQFSHQDMGTAKPVELTYMDGDKKVTILSRLQPFYDGSSYDIPYFYALGWLWGQRLDPKFLDDFDIAEALSKAECQRMKELENFDDDTFTFLYHRDDRTLTTRDFRSHAYGKCLLGSVITEMTWGFAGIGCVLPSPSERYSAYVGHGQECDDFYKIQGL